MLPDLRFHLSRLLVSSCVFPRSGGTETELADLGPPVGLQSCVRTVLKADRDACALIGQLFTVASVRIAGFEADMCLAGSDHLGSDTRIEPVISSV